MGKESNARTTLVKVVVTCLVVALSFGIIFIGEYTISPDEDAAETTATADMSFTPGTYTASAPGMESDVEVTATFDEDSITDVSIDVSGETAGIGAEVGDEMTQQFLSAQSASVDGVSGASVTSGALMDAMQDCIDQAAGGGSAEETATEEMTEAASEEANEEETPEAAAEEIGEEAAEIAAVEEAPEAAAEEEAAEPAAESPAAPGTYTPGTYTASAQGNNGEIFVSVTFTENAIVAVSSDLSLEETEDFDQAVGPEISKQILDAQSAEVDGVSGATITSDAFKSAVEECIAEASSGSAAAGEDAAEIAAVEEAPEAAAEEEAAEPAAEGSAAPGTYTSGTYTASAQGINGEISVSVTFTENALVAIGSDLSCETEDIGQAIGPEISKQILDAQSAEVDGVSGATITSDAFKSAVEECIAEASSGSAAAGEEAAEPAAESPSGDGTYVPGTYSAQAQGISSAVTVTLGFDENNILSAGCDVSGETEDIGGAIGPEICAQILDAQSADIDGVSGASITSDAVKEAAAECIALARGEE